jgi:hypothetical protein
MVKLPLMTKPGACTDKLNTCEVFHSTSPVSLHALTEREREREREREGESVSRLTRMTRAPRGLEAGVGKREP